MRRRRAVRFWPHGQAVKTSPFHGGNPGSIPGRVTIKETARCSQKWLNSAVFSCFWHHLKCAIKPHKTPKNAEQMQSKKPPENISPGAELMELNAFHLLHKPVNHFAPMFLAVFSLIACRTCKRRRGNAPAPFVSVTTAHSSS